MLRKMDTKLSDWRVGDSGTYLEDYYCLKDRTSIEIQKTIAQLIAPVDNKQFICIFVPEGDYYYYLFLYKSDDHYYLVEVD